MIMIGNTLISESILEKHFVCDLAKCKGGCCVAGDAGAPLQDDELKLLEDVYEQVKPYMTEEGISTIEKEGLYVYDHDDKEYVTPLIIRDKAGKDRLKKSEDPHERARANQKECAFTMFENGIAMCSIERAWKEGKVAFRKPVSCHLYPIRVSRHKEFEAINYDRWTVCGPACVLGEQLKVPVFQFVKEALVRKYGQAWVNELSIAADLYQKTKKS